MIINKLTLFEFFRLFKQNPKFSLQKIIVLVYSKSQKKSSQLNTCYKLSNLCLITI